MTQRSNEFASPQAEPGLGGVVGSRAATALFVVGLAIVAANSVLYFFGVETLSHPAVSVLALALLVPKYLRER